MTIDIDEKVEHLIHKTNRNNNSLWKDIVTNFKLYFCADKQIKNQYQNSFEQSYFDDIRHLVGTYRDDCLNLHNFNLIESKKLVFKKWLCSSPDQQFEALEGNNADCLNSALAHILVLDMNCDTESIDNIKLTSKAFEGLRGALWSQLFDYFRESIEKDIEFIIRDEEIKIGGTTND